ncbi:EF-hand calcium-binding domain-containing protein 6-like isoform X2 [Channa argus]|uniref:EF-hand calcium-binding domain-containing protein 6-like isoform X2 n=1 Tax=Channa argus TaxID=215402 RepID=UPI003521297C
MAKLLPLRSEPGQLVIAQRPCTALSVTRSSTRGQTGGGSGQTWIQTDRGRGRRPDEVERLIQSRMASIKSAFKAVDLDGTGLVSKEKFRNVLRSLLSFNKNQLDKVCEGSGLTVDYMLFLRRFSRTPMAQRINSSRSSMRAWPQNTSMSLSEIQNHLKQKIGGNLRTVIRVFRLFDYNQEGHVQQHEFRRILDNYCIHLTDKEFRRLWHHYSPNNKATISYELFLEKLGLVESHNFKIAPVCTKLAMSSRGTTPCETINQKQQRARSQSDSCDAPQVQPHEELQTLFYDKMCMNSTPVWQALQAFDTTRSGCVTQDVLRAVLSSFIFPMNPHSFQKLTSRYGVTATGPVRWKQFLGHFMSTVKEDDDTEVDINRTCEQPALDEDNLDFQDIYPQLKETIRQLGMNEAGSITRADLQHLLERPGRTHPRIPQSYLQRITELLNVLDPEHNGVIQLASLEKLNPKMTSAPTGKPDPLLPLSPDNTTEPMDDSEETTNTTTKSEDQKTPEEKGTTQWADKVSVASASLRTVERLLLDKLCEQLSSVLAELELCDPQHTGYITQEDLKRVLSCCGMPISDTHFNKLCEQLCSKPGRSSTLISYNDFLSNLGAPLTQGKHTSFNHGENYFTESPCTLPESSLPLVRGQRPPSSLQVGSEAHNILNIVFQRMKSKLEQRHASLTDRIQAIIHNSDTSDLSETDVRKILEDSWVILDNDNFNKFTERLGFTARALSSRIKRSVFLAKYEEATSRAAGQQGCDGDKAESDPVLLSAEQCLAALRTRIKTIHGNNLTAFRLMDRKCKGVVDCSDFRVLYNKLGFFCSEEEYDRLLDLIGLHPGGNLNYAEFVNIVEHNSKHGAQSANVQEQLHELLARDASYKWADMSKVLCRFDADNQCRINKKSFRELLFTYALPLNSNEFEQLWLRYDPEGRGSVAVCDFLVKLGCDHEGELRSRSQKLEQTVTQFNAEKPVSADTASLEHIQFDHEREKKNEPPPVSPDALHQIESLNSLSPDMALSRMRELVTASASNLYKTFSAFDQSRTGMVKDVDFRQVLESICARSSDRQYRYMLSKLELNSDNSTVNWKEFLKKFQSHSPLTSGIPELPQQIQEVVSGHLCKITKGLMDVDSSNSHRISKEQFRQLCDRHSLGLTNDQISVTEQKKLQYQTFMKGSGKLDRVLHTNAKSPTNSMSSSSPESRETASRCLNGAGSILQRTKSAPQCISRPPVSAGRPRTGCPSGSMERRMRAAVQCCWKEIQKKCAEEDHQRDGHISTASFLEILQSLSIKMTSEQFENLAGKFDIMCNSCVSYHNFLQHFLLNLKPAETARAFGRRRLPLPITPTSQGVLSKDCVEVMLKTYDVVCSHWTSLRRCFLTSDRTRTGSVSVKDFRKVLCHFGVNLSEEEFFHLCSYFDVNTTGKICYNNFLWAFLR